MNVLAGGIQPTQILNSSTQLPHFVRVLDDGRWELSVDSSMLRTFSDCERKFMFRYVLLQRLRGHGGSAMVLGSWWSRTMELYYNAMSEAKLDRQKAVEYGVCAWDEMKMDEVVAATPNKYKTFIGTNGVGSVAAAIMVAQYYDQFFEHDSRNWKIVAAEAGFGLRGEAIVGENNKVIVRYIGKPDLFVLDNNRWLMPVDHKTKPNIQRKLQHCWKPHHQTAGYIVVGQQLCKQLGLDIIVDRCIINIAARGEPSEKPRDGVVKPRFLRVMAHYSPAELAEWRMTTLDIATRMRESIEQSHYRWNLDSCHVYQGCDYRAVDSVAPAAREIVLSSAFRTTEPWVPYRLEEDEEEI